MNVIFEKEYSDEELVDLNEDLDHVLFYDIDTEKDEYGFRLGKFKITVEWSNDEKSIQI